MMMSVMLAKLLGPLLLIVGLGVLMNPSYIPAMIDEIATGKQQTLLFISGFFTTICGLLLVLAHNFWVANWSVIITILAWLTLVKGATIMLFPRWSMALTVAFKGKSGLFAVWGVVAVILGLVLSYYGFMV